ncbi:MAG: hypothetical protein MJ025_06270 [Victivallaceae bacterium]|nr:hypothetical protein [Victivallaceae bacterium]
MGNKPKRNPRLHDDMGFVGRSAHPDIVCKGCIFAMGSNPLADRYDKAYCIEYPPDGPYGSKPHEVYFDGKQRKYRKSVGEWILEQPRDKRAELLKMFGISDDGLQGRSR